MNKPKKSDWKGDYKHLEGRLKEIQEYKNEAKKFNNKILGIERIHLLVAFILVVITGFQGFMLHRQNDLIIAQNNLFTVQNKKITDQIFLQEADRRSNLVFMFSNIMDVMDEELKKAGKSKKNRRLSKQLIGRIIALSRALKPYYRMNVDSMSSVMLSPERGLLLANLLEANINDHSLYDIFVMGDFTYSELKSFMFTGKSLSHANLSNSDLSGSVFYGTYSSTTFWNANLSRCTFDKCTFTGCGFISANLERSEFRSCNLTINSFRLAKLKFTRFKNIGYKIADSWREPDSFRKLNVFQGSLDSMVIDTSLLNKSTFLNWDTASTQPIYCELLDEYLLNPTSRKTFPYEEGLNYLISKE